MSWRRCGGSGRIRWPTTISSPPNRRRWPTPCWIPRSANSRGAASCSGTRSDRVPEQLAAPRELADRGIQQGVGQRLRLGGLEIVVGHLILPEPPQRLQLIPLFGGEISKLRRIAGGERIELGHVHADDMIGIEAT